MDWEYKFSNIVKDTESNLARVKDRLSFSAPSSGLGVQNGTANYPSVALSKYSATPPSALPGHYSGGVGVPNPGYVPLEQSPGVIMVLQDRLDDQACAIDHLTRSVKRLEDEKDVYHRKVQDLRDELNKVLSRLSERGVDLHTERKLEQWRRDVASEMHSLQTQLQLHKGRQVEDSSSGMSAASSREAHEIRRFMQEECESFRREMDMFRNKLAKVELAMTGAETDTRDVVRRQDRLDQHLRDMLDSQQLTNKDLHRAKGDLNLEKEELGELRSSYRSLQEKLGQLQSHMSCDSNSRSTPTSKRRIVKKLKVPRTSAPRVATPTTSELDLSSGSDFDDLEIPPSSQFSAALNDDDLEPNEKDSEDDYLLTDLNLSGDVSSDDETLDLDDLQTP